MRGPWAVLFVSCSSDARSVNEAAYTTLMRGFVFAPGVATAVASLLLLRQPCSGGSWSPIFPEVFEEKVPGQWRTIDGKSPVIFHDDQLVINTSGRSFSFRWTGRGHFSKPVPEEGQPSAHFWLTADQREALPLKHAKRLRVFASDGFHSVLYYFGKSGFEFDLEAAPFADPDLPRLRALDSTLTIDQQGRLCGDGIPLLQRPVAYTVRANGERSPVQSSFGVSDRNEAQFEVGPYDRGQKLVVDPILTYATYTAASPIIALHQFTDGSLLVAGMTSSLAFGPGIHLPSERPRTTTVQNCFFARMTPESKKVAFVAYFGDVEGGFTSCTSAAVDAQDRIVVTGSTAGQRGRFPTTPDAERPSEVRNTGRFLARIAASGNRLEYSTFLPLTDYSPSFTPTYLAVGAGDRVHLAFTAEALQLPLAIPGSSPALQEQTAGGTDALVLLYDISQRRVVRRTFVGGDAREEVKGVTVDRAGKAHIFGVTRSSNFPLKDPVQNAGPTPSRSAGFVASIAPDYSSLAFGTYVGGQGGDTSIQTLLLTGDETLRVAGQASPNSIPAFPFEISVNRPDGTIFSVELRPGDSSMTRRFHAGHLRLNRVHTSLYAPDGRYCLLVDGDQIEAHPGGAAIFPSGQAIPMAGCLFDSGRAFQMLTPVGNGVPAASFPEDVLVAAPSLSGIWAAHKYDNVPIPLERLGEALEPNSSYGGWLLWHVDLRTPAPQLVSPAVVRFPETTMIAGRNFTVRMYLEVEGLKLVVTGMSSTYASVALPPVEMLPPGSYRGRLVAGDDPDVVSEPFDVESRYRPPATRPVAHQAGEASPLAVTFVVAGPVYPETEVRWNGRPVLSQRYVSSPDWFRTQLFVELPPAAVASPGTIEFEVRNPTPGGGLVRQLVNVGSPPMIIGPNLRIPGGALKMGFGGEQALGLSFETRVPVGPCYALWDGQPRRANCYSTNSFVEQTVEDDQKLGRVTLQLFGDNWQTPVHSVWMGFAYSEVSGSVSFHVQREGTDTIRLTSKNLQTGLGLASVSLPIDVGYLVIVSGKGRYLYFGNSDGVIRRFVTNSEGADSVTQDLELQVDPGQPFRFGGPRYFGVEDAPESFLVATGRDLLFFDNGKRRPGTVPFGSSTGVVLASSRYVYTQDQCLIRYPVNETGLGEPERICAPGLIWGKYPEMQFLDRRLALVEGSRTIIVPNGLLVNDSPIAAVVHFPTGLRVSTEGVRTDLGVELRLLVSDINSGNVLGHWPSLGPAPGRPVAFLSDEILLVATPGGSVLIPVKWREQFLRY